MSRLIILSGPSCVGKSPLLKAVRRFYPELAADLQPLVLYNDRRPRPGEVDGVTYHFRPRKFVEELADRPGFLVTPVRNDLQALELTQIETCLQAGQQPFFEGNPYIAEHLIKSAELASVKKVTCFLTPLSLEEMRYLKAQPGADLHDLVTDVMRRKLLRRTQRHKGVLSEKDLADIEARCGAAFTELGYAPLFDHVLPNHDGEDSDNWEGFYYPLGEARRCLLDFARLLSEEAPLCSEKWPMELFSR